jgi:hypothetical protein
MNRFNTAILIFTFCAFQCASSKSPSESNIAKLDQALRHLLAGDNVGVRKLEFSMRADGTKEYAVIIRSENAEELKSLGISVNSIFGDVIVSHITVEELKKVISLQSVRAVESGSRNVIHQNSK